MNMANPTNFEAVLATCCAQEAAKKQRLDITDHSVLQSDKQWQHIPPQTNPISPNFAQDVDCKPIKAIPSLQTDRTSYSTLSDLSDESAATQVQALTLCFLWETLTVVNNLGLSEEDRNSIAAIIAAIKHHINWHINESMECHCLWRRVQQSGENFDDYLVSLWQLAKTCNFCFTHNRPDYRGTSGWQYLRRATKAMGSNLDTTISGLSMPRSRCHGLLGDPTWVGHSARRHRASSLPLEVSNRSKMNAIEHWCHLHMCLTPAPGSNSSGYKLKVTITPLLYWLNGHTST